MRIVKGVALFILGIILLVLITALFIKKEYSVERSISIAKPSGEVYNYVKLIKNQDYYHKWSMIDTNARRTYKGVDGTEGYVVAWDSDNSKAGKGEQQIAKLKEGQRVDWDLHFIKPFEGNANAYMTTLPDNNQTRVTWGMNGKSKYPMNFMNLFMDNMLGKDMESSLERLKVNLEK